MKKWIVDMSLNATFEGIEANSENEAKEIAILMLLDDPIPYLGDMNEVNVSEEKANPISEGGGQ